MERIQERGAVFAEGRVRELVEEGKQAYVWLIPGSGCQGCSNEGVHLRLPADAVGNVPRASHDCRGACGRIFAPAADRASVLLVDNPVAAQPGDRVLLASRPGYRLLASGVIFLFPLLIFFAAYAFGYALFSGNVDAPASENIDGRAIGVFGFAGAAVIVYYLIVYFWGKCRKRNTRPIWIERVLSDNE